MAERAPSEAPGAPVPPSDEGLDGAAAPYRVRRSDRARRPRIVISELGEAVVVLPRRMPLRVAAELAERYQGWLARHRSRIIGERARLAARPPLGFGRQLWVAGERQRVSAVDAGDGQRPSRGRVEALPGQLIVRVGQDGRSVERLLEAWLRERARGCIAERVEALAPGLGVRPARIRIADQSSRWGSASGAGTLSFNWRLILAPPFVLEAVVVHELVHLRVPGHGPAFRVLLEQHAPRSAEARRWLRANSREIRAALHPS